MEMSYNWLAGLVTVIGTIVAIALGQLLVFKIPAIAKTRDLNNAQNKEKWRNRAKKYHDRVKISQKLGLGVNLIFYILFMPFLVTLQAQPVAKIALDVVMIMMIYDFFYYLMHRFLFHGQGYLRQVHAVHHQARSRISSIDSHLLHPVELIMGVALFYAVTSAIAIVSGQALHVSTIIIATVIYTQLNQINHCRIDLQSYPWKTLNWIAIRHDAHHLDMHKGNFATITLLYDWMFGTLEIHPIEQTAIGQNQATGK
ncbi:MAG: sterol desaturase family protein [Halioglobus sp.]|nr:sterol desaturase family protein [Halioglobus sp.]